MLFLAQLKSGKCTQDVWHFIQLLVDIFAKRDGFLVQFSNYALKLSGLFVFLFKALLITRLTHTKPPDQICKFYFTYNTQTF